MSINRKDLIVAAVCGLMFVTFVFYGSADQEFTIVHRLCNGFFVAGMMMGGAGVILYCAGKGAFDLFGYSAKEGLNLIMPIFSRDHLSPDGKKESYYDYCMRKREEPKKPIGHLLIVGGGYLVLSGILLVVHMVMG